MTADELRATTDEIKRLQEQRAKLDNRIYELNAKVKQHCALLASQQGVHMPQSESRTWHQPDHVWRDGW